MSGQIVRIEGQCLTDLFRSLIVPARLMKGYAEEMQGFRMPGLRGMDLSLERFGVRIPPCLVVLECEHKSLLGSHHLSVRSAHHRCHMAR